MSMTKRLWSISALAVELSRDRRTVAAALKDVPADAMIGTDKVWYLSTALAALDEGRSSRPASREPRESVLRHWLWRLEGWREIYVERESEPVLTFEELLLLWKIDADTLLTWLRSGLPFVDRGDFETGAGFTLRHGHVFDWVAAFMVIGGSAADRRKLTIDLYD
jgi:hypothetical protein